MHALAAVFAINFLVDNTLWIPPHPLPGRRPAKTLSAGFVNQVLDYRGDSESKEQRQQQYNRGFEFPPPDGAATAAGSAGGAPGRGSRGRGRARGRDRGMPPVPNAAPPSMGQQQHGKRTYIVPTTATFEPKMLSESRFQYVVRVLLLD